MIEPNGRALEHVEVDRDDSVAIVSINRPPANAIELSTAQDLTHALRSAASDNGIGALVLTGNGECFSAGLDLKVVPEYDAAAQREMVVWLSRLILELYGMPLPTVAAVNGHAVAAGTLLTLACDYRVAPETGARFGLTGVRVGIPYPTAAMAVITAELAPAHRRSMLLRAHTMHPQDALAAGIVDELQPQESVLARSLEVARDLAGMPGRTYAQTKLEIRKATLEAIKSGMVEGDPHLDSWIGPS